ncbi:MAG: diaminobutyrate--2-oxoglutarate transaminase [Micromonosporaceae bacterium]
MNVFETLESEVRGYCRGWPTVFTRAQGSHMHDENGRDYLDFFAGAGTLNYGHNHPVLKRALIDYLESDGPTHALDMHTTAKRTLLETFQRIVLAPRGLEYKVQFPGPTGANAVESALKLARKVTGRETILSFTNAFHGMSLGALAVTGNSMKRRGAGVPLQHSMPMPYDDYLDGQTPDFVWLNALLEDSGSGLDLPAAIIVETVQGEGGVNVARPEWLRELSEVCKRHDILLIVDDVQMGCGRTGPFFSFEIAGITPDIVVLSKSLSGYGLPFALTLMKPELDVWEPGEHNGTFRGNNPAFVTATVALEEFWSDDAFALQTAAKGDRISIAMDKMVAEHAAIGANKRGRGMVWGFAADDPGLAGKVCAAAFDRGLLIETSGPLGEVAKVLPPLTITDDELDAGLEIMADSVRAARAG